MSRIAPVALHRLLDALRHALGAAGRSSSGTSTAGALLPDGGRREEPDDEHLRDVPDGAGCTEIWEHLSERQAAEAEGDD